MKIAKETWALLVIGLLDLVTTIVFIRNHDAAEANPLFKNYWEMGIAAFIIAKIVMLVGPLAILEWARGRNPKLVSWALRSTIAAYLIMYGIGFMRLNGRAAEANELAKNSYSAEETAVVLSEPHLPFNPVFSGIPQSHDIHAIKYGRHPRMQRADKRVTTF